VKTGTSSNVRNASIGALFAALLFGYAGDCLAHSGTADEQQACTPDVFRLCSAQIPSEDRIVACLNRHLPKLSPACRAVMKGDSPKKARHKR
jgi:hypothetical protein